MYAIMIMTSLNCHGDIICWKRIADVEFSTIEECHKMLKRWVEPTKWHLQCRPVEDVPP